MTQDVEYRVPDGDDMLAAEYVLGTLELSERIAVETRLKTDPALQQRVAGWQAHFASFDDEYVPVPAPNLLPQIEARLFPTAPKSRKAWYWSGLFGGALAAGVVALVVFGTLSPPFNPTQTATLAAEGVPLVFAASYDADTDTLQVRRTGGDAAQAGKDYELWAIGASGVPVSLGLLRDEAVLATLPDLAAGVVLAVSLEAEGGSSTPLPQGPVLVSGAVTDL